MKHNKLWLILVFVFCVVLSSDAVEILIEAESGVIQFPMVVESDPEASGGHALYVPEMEGNILDISQATGSSSITFEITEAGTYHLWGKVFTPGKPRTRNDSFYIIVDGESYIWRIYDWADNWVWRRFLTENQIDDIQFEFKKGKHEIKVLHRVAGTYLDQLKFVSVDNIDVYAGNPDDYVAKETKVYRNLSPYFDMPDLVVPQFPDNDFNIADFGAVGDGVTKNTKAITRAIAACFEAGGGRVVVPKGEWLTGSIHLKSNVNLHVSKGAVLKFSQHFEDYLPTVFTRWEGMECYNYSAPIYAYGLRNIAITGHGLIDGQGDFWWKWKDEKQGVTAAKLYQMIVDGVSPNERILGTPEDGLRPNFVQLIACQGILIENVTFKNGPMWTIHPVYCSDMIVRGMKVKTVGPNNDGINPDSTKNILIEDCYFSTGDDCVVLKSGLNEDGWRVGRATENVVIRRIFANEGHGGVVMGSEMSGSIRNVYAHDLIFDGTDRGIRVKSMRGRGGVVENIWVEDIQMRNMGGQAIRFNMFYGSSTVKPATDIPAAFRNFNIKNITCDGAARAIEITGLPELAIENIYLENISICSNQGIKITDGKNISIKNLKLSTARGIPISLNQVDSLIIDNASIDSDKGIWIEINGDKSQNIQFRNFLDQPKLKQRIKSSVGDHVFFLK